MITEIFVEGRKLDVSADISSLLTFAIDDVKDFSTRSTTFSKTVILPGTANNNAIFGNVFEMGISNDYNPLLSNIGYNFNAAKSAKCIIFQDNLQTFKGTLRLLEIDKDRGRIEYQVALNGDLTTLNVALSNGLLTDLDFSEYDATYDIAHMLASWDGEPGSGVYYPLIDYGTYSFNKHDWDFHTFRPALYVKEYIDKMFAAAGFRYSCDLFNTTRFKKLIIPHNQKKLTRISSVDFRVSDTVEVFSSTGDSPVLWGVPFNNLEILGDFVAGGGNFVFTYTGTTIKTVSIRFVFNATYGPTTGDKIMVTGLHNNIGTGVGLQFTLPLSPGGGTLSIDKTVDITFNTGDTLNVDIFQIGFFAIDITTSSYSLSTSADVAGPVTINLGEPVQINDTIPSNIRQVDFLLSIVKLFNLYVYESQFDDRLINIAPFVDYYTATGSVIVDWTYKLNRDKPIKIKPLSELNSKIYNFNYKDDSDYWNDLYQKRYNQGYGSRIFDSQFEFADQTNTLDLIFAPTPLIGYLHEDKVYPTIFKRTGTDAAPVEETIDSVIRIMQTQKVTGAVSWSIKDGDTVITSLHYYGYAGHLDDPNNPGNDLNFGATNELFFVLTTGDLSNTQFNVYWSSYMAEITDKDSKLLTANFYLTPKDIFELDFSRYITVDGVLFRLNKITDYNATIPSDCEVQLLKVINTAYSFPPGSSPSDDYAILWAPGDPLLYTAFVEHFEGKEQNLTYK